jgi:hypothetical protein
MADIPSIKSLINKPKICPAIDSKERWNSEYTRGGNKWCDNQDAHCNPTTDYFPSDQQKLEDQNESCGCRPGTGACGWGGGSWRSRWGSQKCLAREHVYPVDEKNILKCCSGEKKDINCNHNYCAGSEQCILFMKDYCLGGKNKYFEQNCRKWVNNNYADRDDVIAWAKNVCGKMLNENLNLTTVNDNVLKSWCRRNAKANPGMFDQVMDKYCADEENHYEKGICSCYGYTEIPGATQGVPNNCLSECNDYGYKSKQMTTDKCSIAICNMNFKIDASEESTVQIDNIVQKCSAQTGDETVKGKDSKKIEKNQDNKSKIGIGIDSIFPQQIVDIAISLGLNKIARNLNITLDNLLIMIIVVIAFIFLNNTGNNNMQQINNNLNK